MDLLALGRLQKFASHYSAPRLRTPPTLSTIYVRSFAMNSAGMAIEAGGKWQISNGYGDQPRWRGDGRKLYYRAQGGEVMAVEIATNPEFKPASAPRICVPSLEYYRPHVGFHSGRPPFSRGDAQDGASEHGTGAVHGDTELAGWSEEIKPETRLCLPILFQMPD